MGLFLPNLKAYRERHRITRRRLRELSGYSQLTIQRAEQAFPSALPISNRTAVEIAQALGVELHVLTGEEPLPEATLGSEHLSKATEFLLSYRR